MPPVPGSFAHLQSITQQSGAIVFVTRNGREYVDFVMDHPPGSENAINSADRFITLVEAEVQRRQPNTNIRIGTVDPGELNNHQSTQVVRLRLQDAIDLGLLPTGAQAGNVNGVLHTGPAATSGMITISEGPNAVVHSISRSNASQPGNGHATGHTLFNELVGHATVRPSNYSVPGGQSITFEIPRSAFTDGSHLQLQEAINAHFAQHGLIPQLSSADVGTQHITNPHSLESFGSRLNETPEGLRGSDPVRVTFDFVRDPVVVENILVQSVTQKLDAHRALRGYDYTYKQNLMNANLTQTEIAFVINQIEIADGVRTPSTLAQAQAKVMLEKFGFGHYENVGVLLNEFRPLQNGCSRRSIKKAKEKTSVGGSGAAQLGLKERGSFPQMGGSQQAFQGK